MSETSKILVTGASGNLGRSVVAALQDRGLNVVGGSTRPEAASLPDGISAVKADYRDPASIAAALQGMEGIFLMAPPMDPEAPSLLNPFIDQAKNSGVGHIVFNSALGVDQNESAPLRVIEQHLMASGLNYTILRPNFFMENFSTGFIAPMIAKGGIYLAADEAPTSFISAGDIAAVAAAAFARKSYGVEYNLTGPAALNHTEAAAIISEASGKTIRYHSLSEEEMLQGARDQGMPEGAVQYMAVLYQAVRNGWTAMVTDDVQKAVGRAPISFADFARNAANQW